MHVPLLSSAPITFLLDVLMDPTPLLPPHLTATLAEPDDGVFYEELPLALRGRVAQQLQSGALRTGLLGNLKGIDPRDYLRVKVRGSTVLSSQSPLTLSLTPSLSASHLRMASCARARMVRLGRCYSISCVFLTVCATPASAAQMMVSLCSRPMRLAAGRRLYSRDDEADCFYVLDEGGRGTSESPPIGPMCHTGIPQRQCQGAQEGGQPRKPMQFILLGRR